MAETLIATIEKNAREEIRISLSEYNGHDLPNLRIWFDAGDGSRRPGNKGVGVQARKAAGGHSGTQELQAEARRLGLIE